MRTHWWAFIVGAALVLPSWSWSPSEAQTTTSDGSSVARGQRRGDGASPSDQGAGRGARGARGGRGGARGGNARPSRPTPRWPDGRVNLSQVPGEKGFWSVATGSV